MEMADEALGLGPLQELLEDDTVSEIMVVDPNTIYVERLGRIHLTPLRFTDDESCRAVIERIVTPLGRRIDESTPLVDARLEDGSRVNAIIPPLAIRGPCITIRKFARCPLRMEQLVALGSLSDQMAKFLGRCVRAKKNMIISGGMNIYPAEIEAALELHEHIADVAVFGIPSDDWGESVHAVIVCSAGVELRSEAVIEFSREHLAGYKVPRSVEFRAEIPRTGSGKILKRVLREPWWKDHESQVL